MNQSNINLKEKVHSLFSDFNQLTISMQEVAKASKDYDSRRVRMTVESKKEISGNLIFSNSDIESGLLSFSLLMEYNGYKSGVSNPSIASIILDEDFPVVLRSTNDNLLVEKLYNDDAREMQALMYRAFMASREKPNFRGMLSKICNKHIEDVKKLPF